MTRAEERARELVFTWNSGKSFLPPEACVNGYLIRLVTEAIQQAMDETKAVTHKETREATIDECSEWLEDRAVKAQDDNCTLSAAVLLRNAYTIKSLKEKE